MHRRAVRSLAAALTLGGLAAFVLGAGSAAADSASSATCLTGCTAVFDTAGGTGTFTADPSVTSLTVTVQGAAGAPATTAGPLASTSIGGPGGSTTVDLLGSSFASGPLAVTVGATGGAASVASGGNLIVVAGGGGGAGYVGRLDLPDQIFSTYAGGTGGSPSAPGVTAGTAGTVLLNPASNGAGGATTGGAAGASAGGGTTGTAGANSNGATVAAGGAGASQTVLAVNTAGAGGSGFAGGGGGSIARNLRDSDDNPFDVVGAGGGGSGFLATGLTATAGTANTGAASVTFRYSFSPTVSTTATTVQPGGTVPVAIAGLPANVPFTLVFDGTTVASGMSGANGSATSSFVVAASQAPGSFPVQLVVGGTVAASTSDVTIPRPELAATGVTVAGWTAPGAVAAIVLGILLVVFRRRTAR
jgi:hypothetical protein